MTTISDLLAGITTIAPPAPTPEALPFDIVPLALDLFDYQNEAVAHALRDTVNKPYGYLALDMGLGKTPCALAIAASAVAAGQSPVLIVVPPSLRINWQREAEKFAPWLSVATLDGAKPAEVPAVVPTTDVIICGDSQLAGWADALTDNVQGLIVDEAHRFKNKSKRSKALAGVADSITGVRILMSGTPTPNGRHTELATQVDVLGISAWRDIGGKGQFWNYYAPQIDAWGGRGSNHGDELFQAMSDTWYFRRLRDDVLDLPNKGRTALSLEASGKARRDYLAAEDDLVAWLRDEGKDFNGAARAEALVRLTTLRRLAGEAKVKATVEHVKEILDNEPGGVFVVAEHRDVMDALMMGLAKYNPTTVQGGMTDTEKQNNVDAFTSGASRVLVGQIIAAGVGLTLHGGGINRRVVVVQLPWTPADLRQAEDRLHRIGQTKDVLVEVCLTHIDGRWTIDERLWGMLESKCFAAGVLNDGEGTFLLSEAVEGILDSYR